MFLSFFVNLIVQLENNCKIAFSVMEEKLTFYMLSFVRNDQCKMTMFPFFDEFTMHTTICSFKKSVIKCFF